MSENTVTASAVKGRFQPTAEQVAELHQAHEDLDMRFVGVPGIGVVVLAPAPTGAQRRFRDKMGADKKDGKKGQALEELARCSVVWPEVKDLDAEIEKKRKALAWLKLGDVAAELAGLDTEEFEGN